MKRSPRRVIAAVLVMLLGSALTPSTVHPTLASGYTFAALPVTAVSPASGQLAPTSRALQVQLDTSSSTWTSTLAAQFARGAYGLRLLDTASSSIVWFIPKGTSYSAGSLTLSTAIAFDKTAAVVTAHPGTLIPGTRYSATLATGAALLALIAQDLGQTYTTSSSLCCAYPAQDTQPWTFTTASASATTSSGTSTTSTGTAAATSTGTSTNVGTSSLTASAVGIGTVTTAAYASAPTSTPTGFTPSGAYFDAYISLGNTFASVALSFCKAGATLYWYTGTAWQRVSSQTWSGGCLEATITGASSPSLSQLSGTTFTGALPAVTAVSPGTGTPSGGSTVMISGTGFTDSTGASGVQSISFGTAAVPSLPAQPSPSFTVLSDSSIEVWVTPPGSGTVDVVVTTLGGASTPTSTDRFTYAASPSHQAVAVPSYIYPTTGNDWNRIDDAAPTVGMTVINPQNGPGATCDSSYAAQIRASQAHGIAVLGYVYTEYANSQLDYLVNPSGAYDRTVAAVKSDVDAYYTCYPTLDGIFFDQGSSNCADVATYYAPLGAYVKTKGGRALSVINPGNASNECFMDAADILVTFEGSYAGYAGYTPAAWTAKYPSSRFWHLVHDTPDLVSMQNAVSLSKQNGAGWVYVTGGGSPNPWSALPADPYWTDELQAVRPAAPVVTSIAPNNGPLSGGTPLTIHGSSFSGATQVCVGTNCLPASAFAVNTTRTQITTTVPAGTAGTVDVTVVTPQGTSAVASRDQFTYANPPAPVTTSLTNGDFSQGISGWTPNCKGFSGQGYTEGSGCGQFYTTSSSGIQMKPSGGGLPYEGVYQIVPATANSQLSGTVTVNSMSECGDASVDVAVTLLDAQRQPLGPTLNSDPMFGNITFGHHPYTSCTTYTPANTSTSYYQDMPGWTAAAGTQQFAMNIGSLMSNVPGITPSQVAYVKVQLTDYADTSQPTVTFGHLSLAGTATTTPTFVNVKDAGAKGDGTTDDTAAFASALSTLQSAGGGTLYVPPGTYPVQPSALVIHSNISVLGLGATLKPSAGGYVLLEIQGSNVTLAHLALDGNGMVDRGLNVDDTSSHVTLSHDVVFNIRQSADPTNTSLYYGAPVGIQIYGNVDTVLVDGTTVDNVIAERPECSTCTHRVARGIRISPSGTQTIATNVTIQNSAVSNVGPKDDGDCVVAQDSSTFATMTITHNVFTLCHKRAIKVQVPGVTVANNVIDNPFLGNNYTDPQYGYGQSSFAFDMYSAISAYNSNITVTGNSISGAGSFYNGIDIGNCSTLNTLTVTNNSVHMGTESRTYGGSLIRLSGPIDGVTVTGNTLDNAWAGILQVPAGSITTANISGNTITNVTYPSLSSSGAC